MDRDFIKKAYQVFSEWEKGYRKEAKECDYEALYWAYCRKETREDEKRYQRNIRAALKGQIEFIKHLVALMAIEPSERGTLNYIGRFLGKREGVTS